jgi:acetyl-CoA acetyltransferase
MEELSHTDSLGMTAENLAQERFMITPDEDQPEGLAEEYDVSRESQDRFALRSHHKAIAATDEKRFGRRSSPSV